LALGGGGARGVAHIGFIKALKENGIKPDYITGTSMGAVVGGCYAKGMHIDEIRDATLKLKGGDLIDFSATALTKLGILRSKKVQRLFMQYLGDITFDNLQIPFVCTAVDLYSGKLVNINSGSVAKAVQASSCIPSVFRPVRFKNMLLIDGGVLCRVPVVQAREMGADVVVAVDVLLTASSPVKKVPNIFSMLMRIFDIMDNTITTTDRTYNKNYCDLLIQPEMQGITPYAVKDLDRAYKEGYEIGLKNIKNIKELLN